MTTPALGNNVKLALDVRSEGYCEIIKDQDECEVAASGLWLRSCAPRVAGDALAACPTCLKQLEEVPCWALLRRVLLVHEWEDSAAVPVKWRGNWRLLGPTGSTTRLTLDGERWLARAEECPRHLLPDGLLNVAVGWADVTDALAARRARRAVS